MLSNPMSRDGSADVLVQIPQNTLVRLVDMVDWYRRCLEDVQDRKVVRGLDEAKLGYDRAMDELLRYCGVR